MTEMPRPLAVDRILARSQEIVVTAEAAELAPIAARLRIPTVASLSCRWRLRPIKSGRIAADGLLTARVEQECVVSLDPFPVTVEHAFTVVFVPAESLSDEPDDPDAPDVLPYVAPAIDLGEATVEELALALDPFPRKPGAELPDQSEPEVMINPFAALARRRGS